MVIFKYTYLRFLGRKVSDHLQLILLNWDTESDLALNGNFSFI